MVRGIRGAIQVSENSAEEILEATEKLLRAMMAANRIETEMIASVFLTATEDLDAEFPAYAARRMGWDAVPLMCAKEINKPTAMKRLIRILIHFNSDLTQAQIKHQYLGETAKLRPDLSGGSNDDRSNEV